MTFEKNKLEEIDKLSIEELYEIIEENTRLEEEYKKIVEQRKLKRKNVTKQKNLLPYIIFLILANITVEEIFSSNPFNKNQLIIGNEDKEKILDSLEQKLNIKIDTNDADDYILLSNVFNNKKLSEDEKLQFFDLLPLLLDDDEINRQKVYFKLGNIDIKYIERPVFVDELVLGAYNKIFNDIEIYTEDKNEEILHHEEVHSIYSSIRSFKIPNFLNEGMTELLSNEYFSDKPFVESKFYIYEIILDKMLCELVGEDLVLKSYRTGKDNFIYNYLDSIYGNAGDSKQILIRIDEILTNENYINDPSIKEELKELIKEIENYFIQKKELEGLRDFELLTNEEKIKKYAFYYYENLFLTATQEKSYSNYDKNIDEYGVLKKAYFSSKLKKKFLTENK